VNSIPLVDLAAQHSEIADMVRSGLDAVFDSTAFVGGKDVDTFEREYADFLGVKHCIGVANGTDALEIALRAVGVGPGSEVVLPANTFVATAEAVARAGARPVIADVDDEHLLLDPSLAAAATTARTAAVLPVHLYGQAAPVEALRQVIPQADVAIVEDAAQSQGARRRGRPAGGLGEVAGTSFYPGKNLGAYGDAGAVLTDDPEIARVARLLGNHGSGVKHRHDVVGFNSRLDTMQAVVLRAKLVRLARWNDLRRAAAERYHEMLADLPEVHRPGVLIDNEHVWHLYVVRVPRRDRVLRHLNEQGVAAGIHYPVPVHLQPAFAGLGYRWGDFPVTERAATEILSLPLYPQITSDQQEQVVSVLRAALQ